MAEMLTTAFIEIMLKRVNSPRTAAIGSMLGLSDELQRLGRSVTRILGFLHDLANKGLCSDEKWLKMLQDLAYDADDVLDELEYEILQRKLESRKERKNKALLFNFLLASDGFRDQMVDKLRTIRRKLEDFVLKNDNFEEIISSSVIPRGERRHYRNDDTYKVLEDQNTDSDSPAPRFVGRDIEVEYVVKILTKQVKEVGPILPIVGTGGIGKTTLARVIYKHKEIKRHFDKRIWVSASGYFEATRLLELILEALVQEPVAANDDIFLKLRKELQGRRCLLVLDNVMEGSVYEEWEDFLDKFFMKINPELDSWLLVTTRTLNTESFERYGLLPKSLELQPLSDDDCCSIFEGYALGSGYIYRELSTSAPALIREIIRTCGGVPLAAKLLGSMLRNKEQQEEWSLVLECLEGSRGDVNQVTKLVFDRLPFSSAKRCFAYCSIFPKDFYIEMHQLVELWIAEGCIEPDMGKTLELEDIGYQIVNILVRLSLFQDIKGDKYGNLTHFKMHDLVHDLALSLSSCANVNLEDYTKCDIPPARYLALDSLGSEARIVRTLFLKSNEPDQLSDFRFLRTLNLCSTNVENLPSSIGKLTRLRYLGLSGTNIKCLPDSICKLYLLQTLRLTNCQSLKELPSEIGNLINLRHLHFLGDQNFCMPPRMGRLTSLQTLLFFNVDLEKDHRIDEIGRLKNLRGKIVIRKLELVRGAEEAGLGDLFGKTEVEDLEYQWNDNGKGNDNHEKVLEGLQPHIYIKSLTIRNYNGVKLPSWVLQMAVSVNNIEWSLINLTEVRLINCKSCELIPMLWHLPLLQYLELKGLKKVTSICSSILYDSDRSWPLFPALKILKLDGMPNLERWIEVDEIPRAEMFPCLENLSIQHCPKLTNINHHLPSLKELNIKSPFIVYNNIQLENICNDLTSLMELQIHGLSELTCLPDGLLRCNLNLEILRISSCPNLTHIVATVCDSSTSLRELSIHGCERLSELPEGVNNLCCLEILCIEECPNLKCFPDLIGDGKLTLLRHLKIAYCDGLTHLPHGMIASCPNLRSLRVSHCSNLISFTFESDHLSSLSNLWISNCPQWMSAPEWLGRLHCLSELRIGQFSDSVQFDSFRACLDVLQCLPTLHSLGLYGRPQWTSLPDELQQLSGLRMLHITDFGIEALPDWLEGLSYLTELGLYNCKKLKSMPSPSTMKQFTELLRVSIFGCPLVKKSCKQSGWFSSALEFNTDWGEFNYQENVGDAF